MKTPIPKTVSKAPELGACPFIFLPGELRNRIYEYCVETSWITLQPGHRKQRHAPSRMDFGGLRYTCKVLYTEFSPLYLARTVVSLQPSDIERYLTVFYPRQPTLQNNNCSSHTLPPNIYGRVLVSLRLGEVLDLTPLAGLLLRAPKMHIEIARGLAINPMMRDGIQLLGAITDNAGSVDFQHTVERILFRYSLRAEVVVKLRQDLTFEELFGDVADRSPRKWIVQQGLPVLNRLKIVMESSQGVLREPPGAEDSGTRSEAL